ncbi:MAG: Dph6-related ATP pyrophosphatase [Candidatus Hodarchaeales archaeon]
MKVTCLVSGGKDSIYSLWCALHQFEVTSIITVQTKQSNSQLYHVPNSSQVSIIAKMLNIPLINVNLVKEDWKDETFKLTRAIIESKSEAIITGGIRSEFQRFRFNRAAQKANVKCFNPLWRLSPRKLINEMILNKFEILIISVSSMGFGRSLLGKKLTTETISELQSNEFISDLALLGEGGEYESFVVDAPFYPKKIKIVESIIHWDEYREEGFLEIVRTKLVHK